MSKNCQVSPLIKMCIFLKCVSISDTFYGKNRVTALRATTICSQTCVKSAKIKLVQTPKIYPTKANIGTKNVSHAMSVKSTLLTNCLVPKMIVFIATTATMSNSVQNAICAEMSSKQARRNLSGTEKNGMNSVSNAKVAT